MKKFVNCVYSVFEDDKVGHHYYVELLAGWNYQISGERIQDLEDEKFDMYMNILDVYGGWGNVYILIYGPVFEAIYALGRGTSEYLTAVSGQGGWIDMAEAMVVYLQMSNCANQAEIPEIYSSL